MLEQLPPDDNAHPYPNAKNAVAFHEQRHGESFWSSMREAIRSNVADVRDIATIIVQTAAACNPEMAEEIQTEDFRRYVAGKLGMM